MKKFVSAALAAVMVLSITACGGGEKNAVVKGDLLEGYDPSKETKIMIGNPSGDALTADAVFDGFKAKGLNIKFDVDTTPWTDYMTKLKTQLAAKKPADVFVTDSGYTSSLGGKKAVMDLRGVVDRDLNKDDYNAALYSALDPDGHLWGVPHAMNSIAILYNKDIFDKYKVPYPTADWTFEEMYDIAKKLTVDEDGDGEIDIYGFFASPFITEGWLPTILASGGKPISDDRKTSEFNTKETIEGIRRFIQPRVENFGPDNKWLTLNGSKELAFVNGKMAMILTQSSNLRGINDNAPEGFNYDAQIMPIGWDGNRYCVYVPNQWNVYNGATEQVRGACWEWLKYYLSEEAQTIVAQTRPAGFPINKAALKSIEKENAQPKNVKAYFEGIDEYGATLFENPCWTEWSGEVESVAGTLYGNGGKDFDAKMKELHQFVQEALDYYYKG